MTLENRRNEDKENTPRPGSTAPPRPPRVSLSGMKRPAEDSTTSLSVSCPHGNSNSSTPALRQPCLSTGVTSVTPPLPPEGRPLYNSPQKGNATFVCPTKRNNEFLVCCLTCGTEGCRYENGYTVLREEDDGQVEFDPDEPKPPTSCEEWSTSSASSFNMIKQPIKTVVAGLMGSSGFWSSHKYIASPQLDLKLKTWMKRRLFNKVVDEHFCFLRKAAKETLRYKRQLSVKAIRNAFFGTNPPFKFRRVGFFFAPSNSPSSLFLSFSTATTRPGNEIIQWLLSPPFAPVRWTSMSSLFFFFRR